MLLCDFKGIFKRSLATVDSIENPYDDYYIIKLKPESGLKWIPGEHAIYTLPTKLIKGKRWRVFSVATIAEEGHLMIGTRSGDKPSEFKAALLAMKEGEPVSVRGPFGWFKVKDGNEPLVMIAGGVGITPIRALMKSLADDINHQIQVVYAAKDFYLFAEEIEKIIAQNPAISLYKTTTVEETNQKVDEMIAKYGMDAQYYVSGAPNFIRAMRERLKSQEIKGSHIINDPFAGYSKANHSS